MSAPEPPRAAGAPPAGAGRSAEPGGPHPARETPADRNIPSAAPGVDLGHVSLAGLRKEIEEDIGRIESENGEIDMLMEQVLLEIERHESRRSKMESRLAGLETTGSNRSR